MVRNVSNIKSFADIAGFINEHPDPEGVCSALANIPRNARLFFDINLGRVLILT